MGERTTGLRRPLSSPAVYSLTQNLLGARGVRAHVVAALRPEPGEHILDLGCGPGDVLELLPAQLDYLGIDRDPGYIEAARARFGGRGDFRCADVGDVELSPRSFDAAISIGLLHHLDEGEAGRLFAIAAAALKQDGRLLTLDPARSEGQPALARHLISRDRGRNVRDAEELRALASPWFDDVETEVRHDLARVPYTHALLACRGPRGEGS